MIQNVFKHAFRVLLPVMLAVSGHAQTIDPAYDKSYVLSDLGAIPGVPPPYGGLTFKAGNPNTLLIGGEANQATAKIYQIDLVRGPNGHITGFTNSAQYFAEALGSTNEFGPQGGMDGGLAYGPGNVLFFTTYPDNAVEEILPGHTNYSRVTLLNSLGVAGSVGSLAFVPSGLPGAGRLKILNYDADFWHDATLSLAGDGTYNLNIVATNGVQLSGGPEGAFFVAAGNSGFPRHSVLLSEYRANFISAYEINTNGDPILGTRKVFINNMVGAEGATVDPVTGDLLLSSFGSTENLYIVSGFSQSPPLVSITSPTNGVVYQTPISVTFDAVATQTNQPLRQVEFYVGTNLIATVPNAPFSTALAGLNAGLYSLSAVAIVDPGVRATSRVVTIVVSNVPPVVSLTSPLMNDTFAPFRPITLAATASDSEGIAAVEFFYNGTTSLGQVTNAPYRIRWDEPYPGGYVLSARAFDTRGVVTTSAIVNVVVSDLATNQLTGLFGSDQRFKLFFKGTPGSNYVLEATTDLSNRSTWAPIGTNSAVIDILKFVDPEPGALRKFFRVRGQP